MSDNQPKAIDYQTFIKQKHERLFNTPNEIIEAAILKATGSTALERQRIIKGEVNEVHGVTTKDGQNVIIRIAHNDYAKQQFQKEKWALEQCGKIGVPVPTVLLLENLMDGDKHLSISVENKLSGISMNELSDLHKPDKKTELVALIKKAGQVLSQIHSVKINGFGDLDANGKGEENSIAGTLDSKYIQQDRMLEVATRTSLDSKVILRALEILTQERATYPSVEPKLVHGDYVPKHILVENGQIKGILDFENATGGDPVKDFAYWDFFASEKYPLEALKAGYTNKNLFDSDFERRLVLWKIYLGLTDLGYYDSEKNQGGINHCKRSLIADVTYFR